MAAQPVQIAVVQGSILEIEAEVIVNAANSLGFMGGGVAGVIKRAAGVEVEEEAMRIPADNVALATRAALALADDQGFASLALPGMGTGVGGVNLEDAATRMVAEIRAYPARSLRRVILVDVDGAMVAAWRAQL